MIFNLRHLAQVYMDLTGATDTAWVYASLIALDLGVLVFAVHGARRLAGAFALGICAINLAHFLPDAQQWYEHVIGIVFSLLYAGGIYAFSELFVKDLREAEDSEQWRTKAQEWEAYANEQEAKVKDIEYKMVDQDEILKQRWGFIKNLKSEVTELTRERDELRGALDAAVETIHLQKQEIDNLKEMTTAKINGGIHSTAIVKESSITKPPQSVSYKKFGKRGETIPDSLISEAAALDLEVGEWMHSLSHCGQINDKYRRLKQKEAAGKLNGQAHFLEVLEAL